VRTALGTLIGKQRDIECIIAGGEGKLVRMMIEGYDYPLL